MIKRKHRLAGAASLAVLAFTAAAADDAAAATLAALTGDRTLLTIDTKRPAVTRQVNVSGLGGRLLGIDVRPADNTLYGLVSDGSIVTIDPGNGRATLKSRPNPTLPAGIRVSVDFNPAADRMRVIGSDGTNLRIDVDLGVVTIDTPLSLVQPNPFGATTPSVIGAAYTNSVAGAKATLLFDIDDASDAIYVQIPPNNGVLNPVGGQLGISPGQIGFDIGMDRGGENVPYLINGNRLYQPGLLRGLAFRGKVVQGLRVPVRDLAFLSPS